MLTNSDPSSPSLISQHNLGRARLGPRRYAWRVSFPSSRCSCPRWTNLAERGCRLFDWPSVGLEGERYEREDIDGDDDCRPVSDAAEPRASPDLVSW
jgi:hypothetical protein